MASSTEAWAIFGELYYLFTDKFEGTFGIRHYEDERTAFNDIYVLGSPVGIFATP